MRRITAALIAATIALGGIAACDDTEEITTTDYEDCDTGDQKAKDDDCGYWQKGGETHAGSQPDVTWLWVWFTWVHLGQPSRPPAGWRPPKGVPAPPTRTITRTQPKTRPCALGPAPAPPRPPAPAPRIQAPAPKAPPPANRAPAPARPGQAPKRGGC